jgi:glycosyltransferase involved in cell wall biosynthesis
LIVPTQRSEAEGPLVSVVVPCFNYARFLEECIGSVVAQTYPNWEAIVVDDASTVGDATAEIEKLSDPRIRLIRHEVNQGPAVSRNTGIRESHGDLVLPVDADDALHASYLEKLAPWLSANPEHDAVFPDFEMFGGRTDRIHYELRDTRALLTVQWIPGAGTLFRRSVFERVGGYFEDARCAGNEDWDFWLSVADACGLQVGHVSEPLYRYRAHPGSLSIRLHANDHVTRELMYGRHRALFDSYGLGNAFRAEGYRRSTLAALERRDRTRAARLAAKGLAISPLVFTRGMAGLAGSWIARWSPG